MVDALPGSRGGTFMALLMVLEVPGMTTDQYDQLNDTMGIRGEEDAPDGLVSHVAGSTGDGVVVADVWESAEQLERFFDGRLGPALAAAGIAEVPPRLFLVHNQILRGAGTTAGVIMLVDVAGFGAEAYD